MEQVHKNAKTLFQLFCKEYEESDWKKKAEPKENMDFLVEIAKHAVNFDNNFSAQIVNTQTDEVVYWI